MENIFYVQLKKIKHKTKDDLILDYFWKYTYIRFRWSKALNIYKYTSVKFHMKKKHFNKSKVTTKPNNRRFSIQYSTILYDILHSQGICFDGTFMKLLGTSINTVEWLLKSLHFATCCTILQTNKLISLSNVWFMISVYMYTYINFVWTAYILFKQISILIINNLSVFYIGFKWKQN